MLMPQGVEADVLAEKAAWLEPYCATHGFQFCPRRQIEWFGAGRGRVRRFRDVTISNLEFRNFCNSA